MVMRRLALSLTLTLMNSLSLLLEYYASLWNDRLCCPLSFDVKHCYNDEVDEHQENVHITLMQPRTAAATAAATLMNMRVRYGCTFVIRGILLTVRVSLCGVKRSFHTRWWLLHSYKRAILFSFNAFATSFFPPFPTFCFSTLLLVAMEISEIINQSGAYSNDRPFHCRFDGCDKSFGKAILEGKKECTAIWLTDPSMFDQ